MLPWKLHVFCNGGSDDDGDGDSDSDDDDDDDGNDDDDDDEDDCDDSLLVIFCLFVYFIIRFHL